MTRMDVSPLDWEGTGSPSVGARCSAVTESRTAGRIDVYRSLHRTIQSTLDDRVNSIFGWAVAVTAVLIQLRPLHRYEGSGLRLLYVDWVACGGRAVG